MTKYSSIFIIALLLLPIYSFAEKKPEDDPGPPKFDLNVFAGGNLNYAALNWSDYKEKRSEVNWGPNFGIGMNFRLFGAKKDVAGYFGFDLLMINRGYKLEENFFKSTFTSFGDELSDFDIRSYNMSLPLFFKMKFWDVLYLGVGFLGEVVLKQFIKPEGGEKTENDEAELFYIGPSVVIGADLAVTKVIQLHFEAAFDIIVTPDNIADLINTDASKMRSFRIAFGIGFRFHGKSDEKKHKEKTKPKSPTTNQSQQSTNTTKNQKSAQTNQDADTNQKADQTAQNPDTNQDTSSGEKANSQLEDQPNE